MTYIEMMEALRERADSGHWLHEASLVYIEELREALKNAILWTDEEHDVGQWREEANRLIEGAETLVDM